MWLLVISQKGGYRFHSAHSSLAEAKSWEACKQHDGEDTQIVSMSWQEAQDLMAYIEKLKAPNAVA